MLDNILKSASALGACERLDKVKNFHSLTSLFFTPQGLEFCHKNNFPPLGIFQAHKNEVSDCNMYVDCGCIIRPLIYGTYDIQQQVWFVFFQ